jgi:RND family efflux transporter MFP subunit
MLRTALTFIVLAAAAVGFVFAGAKFAPCSPAMVAIDKVVRHPNAACPQQTTEAVREVEPPAITVSTAKRRGFVERLFVSGTLVAREEADVSARIDALTIVELDAEDGDVVKAGQVLARLDRTQLNALLAENDAAIARADAAIEQAKSLIEQSQAQLSMASDDFERARKLGSSVMSSSQIEQRETAMKTSQAQLDAAQHALTVAQADRRARDAERQELQVRISRTDVVAPFAGVVSRRSAKLGATVSLSGEPLFRIIEDGAIDLEAEVAEQSLPRLAVGMPAKIKLPGVSGEVDGRVRLVNQEVDKGSRTGKVRIAINDVSHARIGAFASGELDLASRDGVAAPTSALKIDGEDATLMVVRDGVVEERKVAAGIVEGDSVEIRNGLAAGESVVARAASFLRPGDKVRPMTDSVTGG